jgi:hypothetical protein
VFHGSATVDGTVDGSLTAFDAPVTISGRVNGDVVVFNGRVVLRSGANVTGDVVSQQAPVVASGATIGGTTKRVQTNTNWEGFGWAGKLAWWLAVSVSTLVVGLVLVWLVGRGAAWILEAGRTSIGPAIGWGLLVFFGLPILAIIALVTLVGIPLGLGLLAALGLIYALGYGATAWIVGRRILGEPTAWVLAFLVGWGILRVLALLPHPRWSGVVRRGGVRPWRAAGGHLAGPDHQPSRPNSRLTDPVPVLSHWPRQDLPGANLTPPMGEPDIVLAECGPSLEARQHPTTAGSRATVWAPC